MLIPSSRHTPEDLEHWRELEIADKIHASGRLLARRIDEAVETIRGFCNQPCYAGVSWGKDSIVLAHLIRGVSPDTPLIHLKPSNGNPDCDVVRDAYFAKFAGQECHELPIDYLDLHASNLPDDVLDKETDRIWFAGWREVSKRFGPRYLSGIRAGESTVRMMRFAVHGESTLNTCAPLSKWSTQDVFAYLSLHDLPVHPAYGCLGGGRWNRERLRVAEIGDTHGKGGGRLEWEQEYYPDALRRMM